MKFKACKEVIYGCIFRDLSIEMLNSIVEGDCFFNDTNLKFSHRFIPFFNLQIMPVHCSGMIWLLTEYGHEFEVCPHVVQGSIPVWMQ